MTTAFWHLTWKEYRANRAFWLAVVVLVAVGEAAAALFLHPGPSATDLIFMLALGAPAFFAAGSAGMAFAVEREEGTIDFLRAAPASPKLVVASKLAVAALATVALYLALWPIALWFAHGQMPFGKALSDMLAGWLLLAFDAIAWGVLFSLLTTRPLLAICQTIVVVSMIAEVPAVTNMTTRWSFTVALATGLMALAADIYLGLRWLDRDRRRGSGLKETVVQWQRSLRRRIVRLWPEQPIVVQLSGGRERGAMLGHLVWQHWRQSASLMLALPAMWIAVATALALQFKWDWYAAGSCLEWIVIGGAALIGSAVFRADQERWNYRFFVEHNVPPRYVWFSRQVLWGLAFSMAAAVIWVLAVDPAKLLQFWNSIIANLGREALNHDDLHGGGLWQYDLPWASLLVAIAVVAYSTGQWTSMFVRSGVIAAVAGVGLAIPLCGWVDLMHEMQISFLWSVLPIPVVLFAATWLRAPDWVLDNTRWSARCRAAAVVLLPAIALLIAMPIYRVQQIPLVSPGFDLQKRLLPATAEAKAGAELVRRASDLCSSRGKLPEDEWLAENTKPLSLVLEASRQPNVEFNDPRTADEPVLPRAKELTDLLLASGHQLQRQGKLDAALDRFIAALRVASKLDVFGVPTYEGRFYDSSIFSEFIDWAAKKGQTADRIDAALKRLREIDIGALRSDERIEWYYVFARHRLLDGDAVLFTDDNAGRQHAIESDIRWGRLMPWERQRAMRMLNLLTSKALERLQEIRHSIAERFEIVFDVSIDSQRVIYPDFFVTYFATKYDYSGSKEFQRAVELADDLRSTRPSDLEQIGRIGLNAASKLVRFETFRRATMIRLTLISWRLKHGTLPETLDQLAGPDVKELLLDTYSGLPFRYFPTGMPAANLSNIVRDDVGSKIAKFVPGEAGIWSMGPNLQTTNEVVNDKFILTYEPRDWSVMHSNHATFWQLGLWFPIPEQKH